MIGQTLGHYRVVEEIGSGGMGVVYRAHDVRLDRDVALKVIRSGLLNNAAARGRFRKEALLLSKLCHPNIAQVYDFDEQEGVEFFVMEYVKGRTLAKIIADGTMPEEEGISVGVQIASALESAAEAGIIHRDLKPSNTMITAKGNVKVLDFGLAKLFQNDENLTETLDEGGAAGTLPYMPPEVLKGEGADFRSDIYSLGALLYEAGTGRRAFESRVSTGLIADILQKSPAPPRERNPRLSDGFEGVVLRCMAKEPGRRFQRASEVRVALETLRGSGQSAAVSRGRLRARLVVVPAIVAAVLAGSWLGIATWRSSKAAPRVNAAMANELAVLPLDGKEGDSDTRAFDNGLVETLTSRLSQLGKNHPLQVVPASEMRTRGVASVQEAREQFGATLGLQLNVQRSGHLVRVNYGLIDARHHRQLAGDTITAPESDPFLLQDRVAESIVKALEIEMQPQEQRALRSHGTTRPSAYDYYLQGRGYLQEPQKRENVDSAIAVFGRAMEEDPNYSLAVAGLGEAYWRRYELSQENRWAQEAQTECEKAAAMDSQQTESEVCLGMVYAGTGKYDQAVSKYRRAVELEPTNDNAIRGLAAAYARLGKNAEAEKTFQAAIAARPQYWQSYNSLGGLYASEARYEDAAKMFTQAIALAPDSFRGFSNLGAVYIRLGRYSEAIEALQKSIQIRPTEDAYSNLATTYFSLRQFENAAKYYSEATKLNGNDYVIWGNLGDSYYYAGKRTEAALAYQKAATLAQTNLEVNPRDVSVLSDLAGYYAMLGKRKVAFDYLEKALRLSQQKDPDVLFEAAMVNIQFGETAKTLDWLAKARSTGFSRTTILDAPALDDLHGNTRFKAIVKTPDR